MRVVVVLGLFIFTLSACGQIVVPQESTSGVAEQQTQGAQVFKMGDIVEMGQVKFTLNAVRLSNGEEYMGPEGGNVYLVADCTVENLNSEPMTSSSMMMYSVQDSAGYTYDVAMNTDQKGSLDGEIASGRMLRGEISFEVPQGTTGLDFIFEPGVFDFGQVIYTIGDVAQYE